MSTESTQPNGPVLNVRDLALSKGDDPYSFDVHPGLTILETTRESGGTTLSLAIGGRFTPAAGTVSLTPAGPATTRQRFKTVALAGVPLIDTLERDVAAREALREQLAWSQPFFARVPRSSARLLAHPQVAPWLAPLGLEHLDPDRTVGELDALDRMRLRVLLALVGRREARMLLVDDPDQLRNNALRGELLRNLRAVSRHLPVLVTSVNPDPDGVADELIDLTVRRDRTEEPEGMDA